MAKFRLVWDEWNLNHIARHGVSKAEIETALRDEKFVLWKHRKRYVVIASAYGRILLIVLEKIRDFYYVITARMRRMRRKRFIEGERSDPMTLPRYSEKEIEKIDKEIRKKIEKGKAEFKPRDETEFKNAEFVSVFVSDVVYIRPHYRRVKGRKVYVRGYYRRRV